MVLVIIVNIISLIIGPLQDSVSLSQKYAPVISKSIKKLDNMGIPQLEELPFDNGELYRFNNQSNQDYYLLLAEVAACKLGGCSAFLAANDGQNSEYFDVMVLLDTDTKIKEIKILDYFSDYGYEITSRRYLKKFKEKTVCSFYLQQDNIDAISGATISSYALEGILSQLCFLNE